MTPPESDPLIERLRRDRTALDRYLAEREPLLRRLAVGLIGSTPDPDVDASRRAADYVAERLTTFSGRSESEFLAWLKGLVDAVLDRLWERHRPLLKGLALRLLGSPRRPLLEGSDVVQDAAAYVTQHLAEFTGRTEAEFVAWLRRVLEHKAIDSIRKLEARRRSTGQADASLDRRGDDGQSLADLLSAGLSTPSAHASRREEEARLQRVLNQLPERQRVAIHMKYLEKYSLKEIAEHLSTTPAAVGQLLARGMRKLRELLDDGGG